MYVEKNDQRKKIDVPIKAKVKIVKDMPVESDNYVVVEFPRININSPFDALKLLESLRAQGYRPLHRLEGAYGNCFVCEKEIKTSKKAA